MTATLRPAPVLRWPGSKWRLAAWIIGHMPRHTCYLELYFGSGAVFFSKAPCNVEIINDLDSAVVSFFRIIRNRPEELAALIALTPWARAEYDVCKACGDSGDELEMARRLMVSMWQCIGVRRRSSRNHDLTGTSGWRTRHSFNQSPVATWNKMPQRIQVASKRLLGAHIENRPALDLLNRHNSPEVLVYADPPYHPDTRERYLYAHEMTGGDHEELLEALDRHTGPVLLSGYDCDLYTTRLRHWHRVQSTARAQNNVERLEALWLNPIAWRSLLSERKGQLDFEEVHSH